MTRLYMWQRYQARSPRHRFGKTCATAQAWRKDDYDVVFSSLALALVITHIALWLSDTLQKATNLGQIT